MLVSWSTGRTSARLPSTTTVVAAADAFLTKPLSFDVNTKTHTYKDTQTQRHNHTQKYTQLASTTTVAAAPPPDFPHPTSPPSRLLSRRLPQPPACRQQLQPACRQQDNKAQSTACRGQPAMTSQALLCFLAVQNSSRGDLVTDSLTHSLTH